MFLTPQITEDTKLNDQIPEKEGPFPEQKNLMIFFIPKGTAAEGNCLHQTKMRRNQHNF